MRSQIIVPLLPNAGRKRYMTRSEPAAQSSPMSAAAYIEPLGPGATAVMASSAWAGESSVYHHDRWPEAADLAEAADQAEAEKPAEAVAPADAVSPTSAASPTANTRIRTRRTCEAV